MSPATESRIRSPTPSSTRRRVFSRQSPGPHDGDFYPVRQSFPQPAQHLVLIALPVALQRRRRHRLLQQGRRATVPGQHRQHDRFLLPHTLVLPTRSRLRSRPRLSPGRLSYAERIGRVSHNTGRLHRPVGADGIRSCVSQARWYWRWLRRGRWGWRCGVHVVSFGRLFGASCVRRIEAPLSSMRCASWSRRSPMASA